MQKGIEPDELLAKQAIWRWSYERHAALTGRVANYRRQGWSDRRKTSHDARLVRIVDFELAFKLLPEPIQSLLLLRFRDGLPVEEVAGVMRVCPRTVTYNEPKALRLLARILDQRGLL